MKKERYIALAAFVASACVLGPPREPVEKGGEAVTSGQASSVGTLAHAGSCMDARGAGTANGTPIQEWICNGTGAQSFVVQDAGNGASYLVNTNANKCVDVQAQGEANGTPIQLYDCNQTAAQTFYADAQGSGLVRFVNTKSGKCLDVSADSPADGTRVQLYDCNGTNAQLWNLVATGGTGTGTGASARIVGGYYPNWTPAPVRIKDIDSHYNLVYLFAATPVGGAPGTTGEIEWAPPGDGLGAATNFNADLVLARRSQGRKIILSVGGAGNGMSFPSRTKSQTFVSSVAALYDQLGGFDGLDWNTFEGSQSPDTSEMIWISQQLKDRFPGFLITAPPAPWNSVDQAFCSQMASAGVLDYAAPQYYDGPGLATQGYLVPNVDTWVSLLGEDKVVVGFGISSAANYWTTAGAVTAWNAVKAKHPNLRGAFDWQIDLDESDGWPFAEEVAPLVNP